MLSEAAAWGGKVLLHREVPSHPPAGAAPTPASHRRRRRGGGGGGAAGADSASTLGAAAGAHATAGVGMGMGMGPAAGGPEEEEGGGVEDITRTTQYQPTMQVQAFWETTGDVGDIDQVRPPKKKQNTAKRTGGLGSRFGGKSRQ